MKRKMVFFFVCLLMVTIGISCIVYQTNQHAVQPYPMSSRDWTLYQQAGKPINYSDNGMGFYAGLITLGIGTGAGVPLIIRSERRKNNQISRKIAKRRFSCGGYGISLKIKAPFISAKIANSGVHI